jgi:general stress protein CsbA
MKLLLVIKLMFTNITYKTYVTSSLYLIIKIQFEQQYFACLLISIYDIMSKTQGCVKHVDHTWQCIKQQQSK